MAASSGFPQGRVHGLILAAGRSRRMGAFKPLLPAGEGTLLEASIQSLLAGGASHVTVVLGHRADEVAGMLRKSPLLPQVSLAFNPDYAESDMLASAKIGLRAMPACDAFFLLPGDMPAIDAKTFRAVHNAMQATGASLAFPTLEGYRKHPPLVSAACIPAILAFGGDGGLREIWRQFDGKTAEVAVEDTGCLLDADTPQDYARLLAYLTEKQAARSPAAKQTLHAG